MMNQSESQEPSMEEILASIRRIISDDKKPRRPSSEKPSSPLAKSSLEDDKDILDLRNPLSDDTVTSSPLVGRKTEESSPKIASREKTHVSRARHPSHPSSASFVSEETIQASREALSPLESFTSAMNLGPKTLEDVVERALRPLLKDWLDNHLPSLVKQIVHEQVEKIAQNRK